MTILNIRLSTISLCVIALLLGNLNADNCRQSCGFYSPNTVLISNISCFNTGYSGFYPWTINWDDGSYSDIITAVTVQLVIGSCCDDYSFSLYVEGIVRGGRFLGADVRQVSKYRDVRQTCDGCHPSSAGLYRLHADILLSIGTKGVGNWIECSGNETGLYSPPLTANYQPVYRTFYGIYGVCSNCVESC